jgi:MerR family transcriptional regulator, heat shock protein HspR
VGVAEARELDTLRINAYTCLEAGFQVGDVEQELYFISVAARLLGMHPQTLRKYERLGLVRPTRTIGSMRLYSSQELERLRIIKQLVDEGGVNLAGVQRLLSIADALDRLRPLAREDALSRDDGRRRLAREIERLGRLVGMDW